MFDLPSLARSLHSSRKLTPAQIRSRAASSKATTDHSAPSKLSKAG